MRTKVTKAQIESKKDSELISSGGLTGTFSHMLTIPDDVNFFWGKFKGKYDDNGKCLLHPKPVVFNGNEYDTDGEPIIEWVQVAKALVLYPVVEIYIEEDSEKFVYKHGYLVSTIGMYPEDGYKDFIYYCDKEPLDVVLANWHEENDINNGKKQRL